MSGPQTNHTGRCHCGSVRFTVHAEITAVRSCDCSVCVRRGALGVRVADADLLLHTPWEAMTSYRWGTRTGLDLFCSTCGILPFRRPSAPTVAERAAGVDRFEGWTVNVLCIDGLDLASLPVIPVFGSRLVVDHPF